jgi:hypothetical protein
MLLEILSLTPTGCPIARKIGKMEHHQGSEFGSEIIYRWVIFGLLAYLIPLSYATKTADTLRGTVI